MSAPKKDFQQQGAISLLAIISLVVATIALPITVKLVQQRQEVKMQAIQICPREGVSCNEIYPETCTADGSSSTRICYKKGICTCIGGGSCCSWGTGSYCDPCQVEKEVIPISTLPPSRPILIPTPQSTPTLVPTGCLNECINRWGYPPRECEIVCESAD